MSAEPRFDEAIHAPTRLRLCVLLRPLDHAEFAALTTSRGVSEATLSRTVRNLTDLGYVSTTKQASAERGDARRTTAVSLTAAGRQSFDGHIGALRALTSPG